MVIPRALMRCLSSSNIIRHIKWNGAMDNIPFYLNLGNIVSQFLKPTFTNFLNSDLGIL